MNNYENEIGQQMYDDQQAEESYAAHVESTKRYNVRCDLCSAEDYAPEQTLRERGWELGRGYEFCPTH